MIREKSWRFQDDEDIMKTTKTKTVKLTQMDMDILWSGLYARRAIFRDPTWMPEKRKRYILLCKLMGQEIY